jgi:hypothetical protein
MRIDRRRADPGDGELLGARNIIRRCGDKILLPVFSPFAVGQKERKKERKAKHNKKRRQKKEGKKGRDSILGY